MRTLWRKTADFFLKHPILWLPYLGAHLLVDLLGWSRRFAEERILMWCPTWHSVLGDHGSQVCDPSSNAKMILVHLAQWGHDYAYQCVFAIELVLMAGLAAMILRGEQPKLRTALAALRTHPKRILVYSLKLLFLSLVLTVLIGIPAYHLVNSITSSSWLGHYSRTISFAIFRVQDLLYMVCFVWIWTPMAIRLLRPLDAQTVAAEEKRLGRYFLILTAVATFFLGSLLPLLLKIPIFASNAGQTVASDLITPVLRFPDLLGTIALVLLAAGGAWETTQTEPAFRFRGILRSLMPLHFQQDKEL